MIRIDARNLRLNRLDYWSVSYNNLGQACTNVARRGLTFGPPTVDEIKYHTFNCAYKYIKFGPQDCFKIYFGPHVI